MNPSPEEGISFFEIDEEDEVRRGGFLDSESITGLAEEDRLRIFARVGTFAGSWEE
jgi:hypothetical protein